MYGKIQLVQPKILYIFTNIESRWKYKGYRKQGYTYRKHVGYIGKLISTPNRRCLMNISLLSSKMYMNCTTTVFYHLYIHTSVEFSLNDSPTVHVSLTLIHNANWLVNGFNQTVVTKEVSIKGVLPTCQIVHNYDATHTKPTLIGGSSTMPLLLLLSLISYSVGSTQQLQWGGGRGRGGAVQLYVERKKSQSQGWSDLS